MGEQKKILTENLAQRKLHQLSRVLCELTTKTVGRIILQ
jgi:hypothetical protein